MNKTLLIFFIILTGSASVAYSQSCSNLNCLVTAHEVVDIGCCGDGALNTGEECDGTQFISKPADVSEEAWLQKTCGAPETTYACKITLVSNPICGDGIINQQWEECDGAAVADIVAVPSIGSPTSRVCNPPGDPQECRFKYDCQLYKMDIAVTFNNALWAQGVMGSRQNIIQGDHEQLGCLDSVFENIAANSDGRWKYKGNKNQSYENSYDDELVYRLIRHMTGWSASQYNEWVYKVCQNRDGYCVDIKMQTFALDDTKNYFFDKSCNPVVMENYDESMVCGNITVGFRVSPISLDFGSQDNWNVVKFKLFPNQSDSDWVVWKAGAKKPLLIYNKNSENITDGRQLFGSWSFGGKTLQNISLDKSANQHLWANGYEALKTLDLNRDGWLKAEELNYISLWFDINQNAISEQGEIKTLAEVGVTSLNVNYDRVDPLSGDHVSDVGYELADGTKGSSTDWFTGIYASKSDAISELNRVKAAPSARLENELHQTSSKPSNINLTDLWYWQAENDPVSNGILVLHDTENEVDGVSVVEEQLAPNSSNYKSRMVRAAFKGKKTISNNETKLVFKIDKDGIITESEAIFQPESGTLEGKSVFLRGSQKISYSWKAKRHHTKKQAAEVS